MSKIHVKQLSGAASETTAVLHVYADGTSGSDANDGLDVARPKKTLQAAVDLIPTFVKHSCMVHATGVFSEQNLAVERFVAATKYIIIDGGATLTTVADNGGSPWVADIHAAGSIGLTTAGWVPNQYQGWWLEMVSGPCAGQHMTIKSHTADTIYPVHDFTGDPGLAQFRICRPSTEFASSVAFKSLLLRNLGGSGDVILQRFYISGSKSYMQIIGSVGTASICQTICNSSYSNPLTISNNMGSTGLYWYYYDTTFTDTFTTYLGVSKLGNTNSVVVYGCASFSVGYSHINGLKLLATGGGVYSFFNKTVVICADIGNSKDRGQNVRGLLLSQAHFDATCLITNPAGVGLTIRDGYCNIAAGCDISNCSGHGIEVINGHLHLAGIVTGSGNGGAGVYAHDAAKVWIKNGSVPTLTGVVGDFAVTNPVVSAGTWAALDGGKLTIAEECTEIKGVA